MQFSVLLISTYLLEQWTTALLTFCVPYAVIGHWLGPLQLYSEFSRLHAFCIVSVKFNLFWPNKQKLQYHAVLILCLDCCLVMVLGGLYSRGQTCQEFLKGHLSSPLPFTFSSSVVLCCVLLLNGVIICLFFLALKVMKDYLVYYDQENLAIGFITYLYFLRSTFSIHKCLQSYCIIFF